MASSAVNGYDFIEELHKKQEQAKESQEINQLMTKPEQDKIRASMAFRRRSQERD